MSVDGINFSLWARQWEPGMEIDYLGNYFFGYNSGWYWKDFTLEEFSIYITSFKNEDDVSYISEEEVLHFIDTVRTLIPNATDEEILVLAGGGGAQLIDDLIKGEPESFRKYFESVLAGGWGDNLGENGGLSDAGKIQEGLYDYYNEQNISKDKKPCSICGKVHNTDVPFLLEDFN